MLRVPWATIAIAILSGQVLAQNPSPDDPQTIEVLVQQVKALQEGGLLPTQAIGASAKGLIPKEALSVFPGAITLVDASDVKPEMKVVKIDRYLPGEPGYLVH